MIQKIKDKVIALLSHEKTLHDWEHTLRVYTNAMRLCKEVYQDKIRVEETAIDHMFEKMLRLKPLMYMQSGKAEAEIRHQAMVSFLYEFFREQGLDDWLEYLEQHK